MKRILTLLVLVIPIWLYGQSLPEGMVDLTKTAATDDATFALTTTDNSNGINEKELTIVGNKLFFTAKNSNSGEELWVTDGTEVGTKMVKDIFSGSTGSAPSYLIEAAGKLYFTAEDAEHGIELWESDGTEAGTKMVADIYSGSNSSAPIMLTNVNDKVFYWAKDINSETKNEQWLWVYDPAAGTNTFVSEIQARLSGDSNNGRTVALDSKGLLFFIGQSTISGEEVWVSDGTDAGTHYVKDIISGTGASGIQWLYPVGDSVVLFREITPKTYADASIQANYTSNLGDQLWVTNGTEAGTRFLSHFNITVNETTGEGNGTQFAYPGEYNGKVYFRATDGNHGVEFCETDLTTAGTIHRIDFNIGIGDSWPQPMTIFKGKLVFFASDATYGHEPRYFDGTEAHLLADVWAGGYTWLYHIEPFQYDGKDSLLYMVADNGSTGLELFIVKDMYSGESENVVDLGAGNSEPHNLTSWQNALYFTSKAFKRLYKYQFAEVPKILPASTTFGEANMNDTIELTIDRKFPDNFTTQKVKVELQQKDPKLAGFRISASKEGPYDFSCYVDKGETKFYVVAGRYVNPDTTHFSTSLLFTSPGVDDAVGEIKSTIEPVYYYDIAYFVNIGMAGDSTIVPVGEEMGSYQSSIFQAYGTDAGTNKLWGWESQGWYNSDISGDKWNSIAASPEKTSASPLTYKFELDNGDYEVEIGAMDFWYTGREQNITINGTLVGESLILVQNVPHTYKYNVTVTNNLVTISIACLNGDNAAANWIRIGSNDDGVCNNDYCTQRTTAWEEFLEELRSETGISKSLTELNSRIYPNPTNGIVNVAVDLGRIQSYEIVNVAGQVVLRDIINSEITEVNLNEVETGIYFIILKGESNIESHKILLSK